MTERVVYFLGAGFSHPFGLPLISTFLTEAKDRHVLRHKGGANYQDVFDAIKKMGSVLMTYKADLGNIEEVLSILEVDVAMGRLEFNPIQEFIVDVIKSCTPTFVKPSSPYSDNWRRELFAQPSTGDRQNGHGMLAAFVAAIHGLSFNRAGQVIEAQPDAEAAYSYDVVTTNYDMLLENAAKFLAATAAVSGHVGFRTSLEGPTDWPALAKLHGSVDGGRIVAPTWNKTADSEIMPRWKLARDILGKAQHIRFIGYSLPDSDSYVRYLLKASALESEHLKSIEVICFDPGESGDVEARYDKFISRPHSFRNMRFEAILREMLIAFGQRDDALPMFRFLEAVHKQHRDGKAGKFDLQSPAD